MNLIQISERLKEAPDNTLLQEVRTPTGQYPAYLIITEMARRKKMREGGAPQQAPQTTVAEDMANEEGGLAATPQAMGSTAGMDVNGQGDYEEDAQEMPQMASGGIVSFKRGLGVRDQINEDRFAEQSGFKMSVPGEDGDDSNLIAMLPGAMRDVGRYSELQTPEQRGDIRAGGESRFEERVPFRRGEEASRIAAREQAIVGERESNANMALMEAGLGMMGSKATRGMQGIAEGGLRGLSSFKSGKQDIKKSEAYLDQSKDNYARAQELYDQQKYAAGDKALSEADRQQALGLAGAQARLQGISSGLTLAHQQKMRPMELESQQKSLQLARDTYDAAVEAARLKPNDIRSEINLRNAQAEYYRLGGKGGGGLKAANMGEVSTAYEVAGKRLLTENTRLPANQRLEAGSPAYHSRQAEYARSALLAAGKYVDPVTLGLTGGQQTEQRPGTAPQGGALVQNPNGSFTYQPRN